MKQGDRVWVSGDSVELWIGDYNVRVSTGATVEETPSRNAKKVLLTLDTIDGEGNVCCFVRKSKVEPITDMAYALVGYDKDNDVYEVIETHKDLEYLKLRGNDVAEIQKETNSFRRSGYGEPFDWFEIVNANDTKYPNCYYWASYCE